jgi:spermidine synthase
MPVYMKKFYLTAKKALMPGGLFVTHASAISCISGRNISSGIFRKISGVFPLANLYSEYIPSFGSLWSFVIGSLKYSPERVSVRQAENRITEMGLKGLLYYDAELHRRLFRLPKCLKATGKRQFVI